MLFFSSVMAIKRAPTNNEKKLTQQEQEKFDHYYYEALLQKEKGDYAKAFDIFVQCYAIDSLDAGLSAELGMFYAMLSDKSEEAKHHAIKHLKFAADKLPDNWWVNLQLLGFYAQTNNATAAIALAERMQTYFPYNEEIYHILASLYKENKQYKKSIAAYDQLESMSAVREETTLEKCRLYMELKQPKKAIAEIEKLIKKYPHSTEYQVLLGNIYLELGENKKALEVFEQVAVSDPESPDLYIAMSDYYSKKGDKEKANDAIRKALTLEKLPAEGKIYILGQYVNTFLDDTTRFDETESLFKMLVERYPIEADVHIYYSRFLQFRNRTAEAVSEIESALAIDSKNENTWGELVNIYLSEQNFAQLLEATTRAIENLPTASRFYYFKTIAEFQTENYQAALLTSQTALETVPDIDPRLKSDFYGQIGDIYYKLHQSDSAFVAFDEALKVNPANIMIMNNYAYYLSEENKDLRKAETMSAKTVEKEPTNSTYLDTYAWIFYKQGNYSLAKFYIERAIDNLDKDVPNGVVLEHYGDILFKTGDNAKALEIWKLAAEQQDATAEVKQKAKGEK
jgi:tetratricopeptide (TPR) repeat protein